MTQTEILAKMQTVFDDVFLDDVKVTPQLSASVTPKLLDTARRVKPSLLNSRSS